MTGDKREKVLKGLEYCTRGIECAEECPYGEEYSENCMMDLMKDALEVLKPEQPRVLTLEEAENVCHDTVCEFRYGIEPTRFPPKTIKEWINGVKYRYGQTMRCWTEMPTDEQRAAEKWG